LACLGIVVVQFVAGALTLLHNYTAIGVGQRMVNDLRGSLYSHLQRLSLAFHSRQQVGDIMLRITGDSFAVQTMLMNGLLPIISAIVLLAGMLLILIPLDPVLTMLSMSVVPVLFLLIAFFNRRFADAAVRREKRIEDLGDLGKIGERAGQPVDLVDDHDVDPPGRDVGEQPLQSRPQHRSELHCLKPPNRLRKKSVGRSFAANTVDVRRRPDSEVRPTQRRREPDSNHRSPVSGDTPDGPNPEPRPRRVGITRKFASGVGEIPDGHRWDSSPKIRFAPDSPLEGEGFELSVPPSRTTFFATALNLVV
jgi:hypothetical protein